MLLRESVSSIATDAGLGTKQSASVHSITYNDVFILKFFHFDGTRKTIYIFFHVLGLSKIRTGSISSLPISMVNVSNIFEKSP